MSRKTSALMLGATLFVAATSLGQDTSIRPFRVHVPETAITDLRHRIHVRAAFKSLR
jgi:hypothetical protein